MCLSEPHAGSSLADISTRAERQRNGTYRLTRNKMWISGGDHDLADNILHLVLAKVPEVHAVQGIEGPEASFYRGKLTACRYFYRWELPRVDRWLGLLEPIDRTAIDADEDCFA